MANITGIDSGLVVPSIEVVRTPKKKRHPKQHELFCGSCGFVFNGTLAQQKKVFVMEEVSDNDNERECIACSLFFGNKFMGGCTNVDPDSTKKLMKRAEEGKYIILLKTMNFGSEKSGISFTVDFGDIFQVKRIGTAGEPDASNEDVFKRFTIDIEVGVDTLTLYPHEFGVMTWVEIMSMRKEKLYEEAYLCQEDKQGYFKPTKEGKEMIVSVFGDR